MTHDYKASWHYILDNLKSIEQKNERSKHLSAIFNATIIAQRIQDGTHVLVPREPTAWQLMSVPYIAQIKPERAAMIYKAMIAAAQET